MNTPRATWFCIDIEANGPVPGLYDMVSLGATVVFTDATGALQLGEDFYMELCPVAPRFDSRAAAIHGLDQARLKAEGLSPMAAAETLASWVLAQTRPQTEPVFVGHNAPFDWSHVAHLYAAVSKPNPFGYKALDTKAFSAGVLNLHWLDTGKDILFERLSLPPEDKGQKHRADYDARVQAELLRALLNRQAGV
jgi:DNA polymerase III epsilon subunit-like protein